MMTGLGLRAFAQEPEEPVGGGGYALQAAAPPIDTSELLADLAFTTLDLQEISITELQRALAAGDITSAEVVDMYLERIAVYDRPRALNSIILVNPRAAEIAAALDAERTAGAVRGPLHGVPIIIKDNYDYEGMPTSAGSKVLQDSYPYDSAFTVKKLEEAGAIILAKANLSEFANSRTTSQSSLGGTAHNPYAVNAAGLANRASGGSSGGSGAAVAANFGLASMGTDTGGSIRSPGHANGLFALKPTWGVTSREGVIPLVLARDVTGPLARTATDIAYMMDAIVGTDPQDDVTKDADSKIPDTYTESLDAGALSTARIGWLSASRWVEPASGSTLEAYLAANPAHEQWQTDMEAAGATFVDVNFPYQTYYNPLYRNPNTPDGDALNTGWGPIDIEQYFRALPTAEEIRARGITEAVGRFGINPVHSQIDIRNKGAYAANGTGDYMISSITSNANNIEAGNADYDWEAGYRNRPDNGWKIFLSNRSLYQAALAAYLDAYNLDCFAYFMWRGPATTGGTAGDNANYLQGIVSHGGFPDLVVPIGVTDGVNGPSYPAGMPICVDLVGRAWDDGTLIKLAYAYEQAYPHRVDSTHTPPLPDARVVAALSTLITAVLSMDLAYYTPETADALCAALADAQALKADASSAQAYENALFVLADRYDALLSATDKSFLVKILAEAAALVEDGTVDKLIDSVRTDFLAAYETALAVEAAPYATPAEVLESELVLLGYIHKSGFFEGDKNRLAQVLNLADLLTDTLDHYVKAGQDKFLEALTAAKAAYADGDALQPEVDAAWNALTDTILALRLRADKSLLDTTYRRLLSLDLSRYTPSSVAPLRHALNNAADVLANEALTKADQAAVDDTLDGLMMAERGLVPLATESETKTDPPTSSGTGKSPSGSSFRSDADSNVGQEAADDDTPLAPLPLAGLSFWAQAEVDALNARGLIPEGLTDNFQAPIRRDEFVAVIISVYEYVEGAVADFSSPFTDIADSAYKAPVEKARTAGLVDGTSPVKFTPDGPLTREQTAKILCAVVAKAESVPTNDAGTPDFADLAAISSWAVPYVAYCQQHKIMLGGTEGVQFDPRGVLTREMALIVAERLIVQYEWTAAAA
jgi:Asp-tRNA(Asn)/Glu-tRNA(Gln) amidotransferase A subunit family amidase